MRLPILLIASLLAACSGTKEEPTTTPSTTTSEPETAVWMETVDWGWQFFNHRVSYIGVHADAPRAGIIGGTSTTGINRELAPECDLDSCKEFPFVDNSLITLGLGSVTTSEASFVVGTVSAMATAEGVVVPLVVPAPDRDGAVVAVLQGFTIDTDHPLDGDPACYDPAYGWHPTRIAIALENARRDGDDLVVDARFTFGAGVTEDPDRGCIDEVQSRALIPMSADVLFVVADEASSATVSQGAYFAFSGNASAPGEQVLPDAVLLDGSLADALTGWSKIDWTFNPDSAVGRGAYLRTLSFGIDGDTANGTATNYSPVTQLHDFEFAFDGEVQIVPLAGVEHRSLEATLPAELDANGDAVIHPLE